MLTFSVFSILTVKTSDESLPSKKQLMESVVIVRDGGTSDLRSNA